MTLGHVIDQVFYRSRYASWVAERHAHLAWHKDGVAGTKPEGGVAGAYCTRCQQIEEQIHHFASRIADKAREEQSR